MSVKRYYIAGYDDCGLVLHSDYLALQAKLEKIEVKVSGGLCQFTAEGKHCFLKDIKEILADLSTNKG